MAELAETSPVADDAGPVDGQRPWLVLTRLLLGAAAVGGIGIVLGVRVARTDPPLADDDPWLGAWLLVGLVNVLLGATLVRRLGHRRLAACLMLIGFAAVIAVAFATTADVASARQLRQISGRNSWAHAIAAGVLIALVPWELVPTKRRPMLEVVWWSTAAVVGLMAVGYAAGASRPTLDVVDVAKVLLAISATAAVGRVVAHWWRSGRGTSDPLSAWMVAGALVAWLAIVPRWLNVLREFRGDDVIGSAFLVATLPLLVVGISVRAMRERPGRFHGIAYEVIAWIVLSGAIVLLYTGVVVGVGEFVSGRGRTSLLIATTCLLAIGIEPLRRRIQSSVDRLVWGIRDDPLVVVRGVLEHVSADSVDELLPSVADSLRTELKLDAVAIEVFTEHGWTRVASSGLDATTYRRTVLLRQHGEVIGRLIVGWEDGPHLRHRDEHVLAEIVQPLALAVGWVRLVDELRRSGVALIAAREEERRRLSRDFHDGVGPSLTGVALGVRAAVAKLARDDPDEIEESRRLLMCAADELDGLIVEVRRIARDLRPSTLDQLGLVGAIDAFTRSLADELTFHVTLPSRDVQFPAAIEVAVYRIVTEAITNVIRHAAATQCWLRMSVGRDVEVDIIDDGIGIPDVLPTGVGLTAMRERASELGGRVHVHKVAPSGTSVEVRIPVGRP